LRIALSSGCNGASRFYHAMHGALIVISADQKPQSLIQRLRWVADERDRQAAAASSRFIARGLQGAAEGYRALANALEQQRLTTERASQAPQPVTSKSL
jgi:hypothetical protein